MKLAICIPTHQGRRDTLAELLGSIAEQSPGLLERVEICISDNASRDGTQEMLSALRIDYPFLLKYFRFETDRGVQNFFNVVEMANAEYCWIIGSDDALPEGSLIHVMAMLDDHPEVGGMSLNKYNFDDCLEIPIGTDHPIVLPSEYWLSREIDEFGTIASNLFFSFLFLSSHIFRRDFWRQGVSGLDENTVTHFRHFVHSFLYLGVARQSSRWLWEPRTMVVQRLGNSCVLKEGGDSGLEYAVQVTEDILKFAKYAFSGDSRQINIIARKLYVIYWNPLCIASYKNSSFGCTAADVKILRFCLSNFSRQYLFWVTGIWLCITPYWLLRPVFRIARHLYRKIRNENDGIGPNTRGGIVNLLMVLFRIGNGSAQTSVSVEDPSLGEEIAEFLESNRRRLGLSVKPKIKPKNL